MQYILWHMLTTAHPGTLAQYQYQQPHKKQAKHHICFLFTASQHLIYSFNSTCEHSYALNITANLNQTYNYGGSQQNLGIKTILGHST